MEAVPACPKCADGGLVLVADVPNSAASVFTPLPKGEPATVKAYKCSKCGWTLEVRDERPSSQPSQPRKN